jgi:hypothetical protein
MVGGPKKVLAGAKNGQRAGRSFGNRAERHSSVPKKCAAAKGEFRPVM